ncbi:metallopeptidase family protein [Gordonia sp. ABSL1-1]|uniref:metallopeptidase family protein n=1 Tax=Gordonia sp. ABSL1-1 TaxID=3053923 RepID=UPI002572EB47|nr:metallopeptidase family protein [Gordonia sp. ABSL1-1]MDL9935655.1 metallopeptidase family protein [Gordonia sp. ABSL1-1]
MRIEPSRRRVVGGHRGGPPRPPRRPARLRDRRGRGLRAPLLPPSVPAWNSRSDEFDAVALEAFAEIDASWHDQISELDIAVDEIPRLLPRDPETVQWPDEVTADGAVPLARLIPAGIDVHGLPTRAQIILFRRPLESRAKKGTELLELVHEVLVQQVATHLGVDEDVIDRGPE